MDWGELAVRLYKVLGLDPKLTASDYDDDYGTLTAEVDDDGITWLSHNITPLGMISTVTGEIRAL